ncbi:MAG: hypothetical protein CMN06_01155 [Roseibacillus sp.]|nr:hypothetical protein [Roseibacillus sp.]
MFRHSLFASADIKTGEALTARNVRSVRPGYGLAPKHLPEVLGKKATRDIPLDTPLALDLLD